MTNWFAGYVTVASVKTHYHDLAKRWHPDCSGKDTNAQMAEINAQYKATLAACDGETYRDESDNEHTYRYNAATEDALMRKIAELLVLRMKDVKVLLIGTWIWCIGETRPHKEQLKALGLWWNGKRLAWSYHVGAWHGRHSNGGLDSIAATHGVAEFRSASDDTIAA